MQTLLRMSYRNSQKVFPLGRRQAGEEPAARFVNKGKAASKVCTLGFRGGVLLFCTSGLGLGGSQGWIWCSLETRSASGDLGREVCFEGGETAAVVSSTRRQNVGRVEGGPERSPAKMGKIKK